jgi:hypothetical protein
MLGMWAHDQLALGPTSWIASCSAKRFIGTHPSALYFLHRDAWAGRIFRLYAGRDFGEGGEGGGLGGAGVCRGGSRGISKSDLRLYTSSVYSTVTWSLGRTKTRLTSS